MKGLDTPSLQKLKKTLGVLKDMYFTSVYTCIFYKFSKESQAVNRFLDVRGWGHLTGKGNGGLGLSEEEATVIQDARRDAVVDFLNHRDELIWMAEEYIKLKSK